LPDIKARLYFDGSVEDLRKADKLIFDVHGGGFVSMEPKNHDDYLSSWARELHVPIICINYGKAPEYPYPWAIEECFDAYRSIVESNGECIGLSGWTDSDGSPKNPIHIVVVGDSAGGNIATGVVMKAIEYSKPIRLPCGLFLIYPCMSFDMNCWMSKAEMELLNDEFNKEETHPVEVNRIIRNKTEFNLNDPLHMEDAPKSVDVVSGNVVERSRMKISSPLQVFSSGTIG
jgi:acetyl esterase/lipase